MSKGQTFLQKYIQRPLAGLVDGITLGATDLDKLGRNKDQTSGLSAGFRRGIAGFGDILTQNRYDFDQKGSNAKIAADQVKEFEQELGDPLNRGQYNRDFRNMMLTNTILRDYELGREAKRNMAAAKQYFEMAGAAQETAARRRLMEDQFSPTKISQQRLRAQQGEAALMNAIANQASAGAQIGSLGTGRRFGK